VGKSKPKSAPTLDLHAFRPEDVFDAVEKFLLKHTNATQVRIMPGKGTGKVKAQVIEYLRLANYSWSFERLESGQANEGVMIVYME
jgi:dsDNA-specific endonuclease/ATPase MutS2